MANGEFDLRQHFAAIVENSFDAIVSKNLEGTIQSWNKAAETVFGWTAKEIVGKSIRTIIPDDLQAEENRIIARIRAGEIVPRFETIRLRKDGTAVPVEITVSPIRDADSKIVGASKIASDISATQELRSRIRESERQFRVMANSMPQLAWIADREGSVFWYNDRWHEYTGSTLEEMRGWGWTAALHPDHVERVKERIQRSWDSRAEWEDTFPLRGRDGRYRWFLSRAVPVLDETGNVWRWFGTNTDVTEQRENEEKIRILMGEVSHRAKNMISVVQALVARTADREFAETLSNRLMALSRNQDLLTRRNWGGARIGELITSQIAPFADQFANRIVLKGDLDILILPSASEAIGLAIHELGTNAVKYGSLSVESGTVTIECSIGGESGSRRFQLEWEESGGPVVSQPTRCGFGSVMIDRNPRLALEADVEIGYPPTGFFWKLTAPFDRVASSRQTAEN